MFVGFALSGGGVEGAVFIFGHCKKWDVVACSLFRRFELSRDRRYISWDGGVEVRTWEMAVEDEGGQTELEAFDRLHELGAPRVI